MTNTINISKGALIKFGHYQYSNNISEPIQWLILDTSENEALLISKFGIACKQYNREYIRITWEQCDLRKWLNNEFLNNSFSAGETDAIIVSHLSNNENPEFHTDGGNDTNDRIFCLSLTEAMTYIQDDSERKCLPNPQIIKNEPYMRNDCCFWWLRSPGRFPTHASRIGPDGSVVVRGHLVNDDHYTVRPAMRINIKSYLKTDNFL